MIDAHVHLWDPEHRAQPWMVGERWAPVRRRFDVEDLGEHLRRIGASSAVLVQTTSSFAESLEMLDIAAESDGLVSGVVGWVDLTRPEELSDAVRTLRSASGGDRLVGVRHQVEDEPDSEFLLRPDVLRSVQIVGVEGLVFDLLVGPEQRRTIPELVDRCPDTQFVLDHAAKPPLLDAQMMQVWAEEIARIAASSRVSCKVSSLVTQASWSSWTQDDLSPAVHVVIEQFGIERLLVGSDWPLALVAAPSERVWQTAADLLAATGEDVSRCFGPNAQDVYGLQV